MESGTGIFQKSIIDAIYSIRRISQRSHTIDIHQEINTDNIDKQINISANIEIHSVEKEVKNMVENGLLEKRKTCQRLDSFL